MVDTQAGRALEVLMLVENESVPHDRRVWQECLALTAAGHAVTVICPSGSDGPGGSHEVRDGVEIHRYPCTEMGTGLLAHVVEYTSAAWHIGRRLRGLARRREFDVVHAANPPDFLLLLARLLGPRRARLVFDHHDLVPEMYAARFGGPAAAVLVPLVRALERSSMRAADVVISTNESYRSVALTRGGKAPQDVVVVRNAPDTSVFRPRRVDDTWRRGRQHLLVFVGVMDPHDGVDDAVRALAALRANRDDWRAVFVGDGSAVGELSTLAASLGMTDDVEFVGWKEQDEVVRIISSADVCLAPEPANPYCDRSTMMKVAEYMAVGRPVVAFDLTETRFTAADAARYARNGDVRSFADHISALLDSPAERERMGRAGRARVERDLSWANSEQALLEAYRRVGATDGTVARVRGDA